MRLAVARDQGVDEEMAARAADAPGELAERHRIALAVADAVMTTPRDLDPDLAARARAQFGRAEIVELVLDVMKWNYHKVVVALGLDVEVVPGRISDLAFDEEGRPRF